MHQKAVSMYKMMGLAAAAAALVLAIGSTTALAQDFPYELGYYSNAHTGAPDGTLRLVNDGAQGDTSPTGDLCAAIYVFNANEQLSECCSCKITPNGLLTLSVNTNLTGNPLQGVPLHRGVVKVISTAGASVTCDATAPLVLVTGIKGWLTHIQMGGVQTEEELTDALLGDLERLDLAEDCTVAKELGSGQGVCTCLDAGR